jgi:hypothetical protein
MVGRRYHPFLIRVALAIQAQTGYPSVKDIAESIKKGGLLNFPITKRDLDNAERIWGKIRVPYSGKPLASKNLQWKSNERIFDKELILCIKIFLIGLTFLCVS